MNLTKFDYSSFRGERASQEAASQVAFNPLGLPGFFVFAGAHAIEDRIGSQVAFRMALENFLKGVQSHYDSVLQGASSRELAQRGEDATARVLEDAFRQANSSVYSFGHQLAAGGRLSASLLGLVVEDRRLATARVGSATVYLYRRGELFPFFETTNGENVPIGDAPEHVDEHRPKRSLVGANSLVDVELASVALEGGDILCIFSRPLTPFNETLLVEALEPYAYDDETRPPLDEIAHQVCSEIFTEPETLSFGAVLVVGPDAIYCSPKRMV
jgi:hypothetical protein